MNMLEKLIEQWHNDKENTAPLNEYIGMTEEEYKNYVSSGTLPDHLKEDYEVEYKPPTPGGKYGGALIPKGQFVIQIVPFKRIVNGLEW